jgi:hypothetical protein
MATLVRICKKEKEDYDQQGTFDRGRGRKALTWLNERTNANVTLNAEQRWAFVKGEKVKLDTPDDVKELRMNNSSYHAVRCIPGPGWSIEHHMFFSEKGNPTPWRMSNWHTDVKFDDDYLALEFKLISPWLED